MENIKNSENPLLVVKAKKLQKIEMAENENKSFPGYPVYPADEDIFNKNKEEDVDPEDTSKSKIQLEKTVVQGELDFNGELKGGSLDVPGSELDDEQEDIGNEDEENNYYSLGGDNHNELEEDNGE